MFRRDGERDANWGGPSNPDNSRGPLSGRIGPSTPSGASGHFGGGGGQQSRAGAAGGFEPPQRGAAAPPVSAAASQRENNLFELKRKVQSALIAELDPKTDLSQTATVRRTIEELFNRILEQQSINLPRQDRQRLFEAISAEILGYGPIEPLLNDDSVTEIMVNGPRSVFVEQNGRIFRTDVRFRDDDHAMRVVERIVSPLGRRVDESQPFVDARLPDGSRVNIIIPPLSLIGPVVTIRKFSKRPLSPDDLIRLETATAATIDFLRACVEVRLNVIVSGGTGSGKTTLLNVLSGFIPGDQRIITIEDAAELQLRQEHVIPLESRPANIEGKGRITARDLVANALRMRPDRIVVGEVRGAEALDMLQAMNTGHDGSLTTLHSNSPRDTLRRIETMVLMAGMDLPLRAIREQVTSAINLIVHQERMRDGSRKVTHITEIVGMEGDVITLQDLFVFEQAGYENGRVLGRLRPTGIRPSFIEEFELANIHLPPQMFGYGDGANWRG
ncbi:MAG TPA: CpaF family protein [Ktedonobacterales bacterium]|nr:CpaF family protein [Ktedonobacterales bacterium]